MEIPLKASALIAGIGAVLNTGAAAHAGIGEAANVSAEDGRCDFATVCLHICDGKIFISELGGLFEEITLCEGPESATLRKLIQSLAPQNGVLAVPIGPEIIARGGASGGWSEPPREPQPSVRKKREKLPNAGAVPDRRRDLPQG